MKNLKVNKKLISLITASAISLSLSGCNFNNSDDERNTNNTSIYQLYEGKLENDITDNVVTENGLYDINKLSIVNKETKEKLDLSKVKVLVNENDVNTLMSIDRDLTLIFSDKIIAIYYNDKEISITDYIIIDENGVEISTIKQLFVDNKEVEFNNSKEETEAVILSMEQFNDAITKFSCKLTNRGVNFVESDILKTAILVNLPVLSTRVNENLLNELLILAGNPDFNELLSGYSSICNAFNNPYYDVNPGSNYKYFYEHGIPYEQLTHLGDLVLGKTQKTIYNDINNRLNTMSTMLDTYELDDEFVKLVDDIKNGLQGNGVYSSIDNGTMLALSVRFANTRGMIFMDCTEDDRCLTRESQKAVKIVAPYISEESDLSLYGDDLFKDLLKLFYEKEYQKTFVNKK